MTKSRLAERARKAESAAGRTTCAHPLLWMALVATPFVLRVTLAFTTPSHPDSEIFLRWWSALAAEPWGRFYSITDSDHLPGDLGLHGILAYLTERLTGSVGPTEGYITWFKVLSVGLDGLLAWAIYRSVRLFKGEHAARLAAVLLAWSPAIFMISAIWGQWDSLSTALLLIAFWILSSSSRRSAVVRTLVSSLCLAAAILTKPQLILAIAFACLVLILSAQTVREQRALLAKLATMATWSALWGALLCAPFRVAIPGLRLPGIDEQWTLTDRATHAAAMYKGLTYGAANLWFILMNGWQTDETLVTLAIFPVSPRPFGHLMLGISLVIVGLVAWRACGNVPTIPLAAWAAGMAMLCFYLFETRTHERYLFPWAVASVLVACLAKCERLTFLVAIATHAAFASTIALPLNLYPFPESREVTLTMCAVVLLCVFLVGLLLPRRWQTTGTFD